MFGVIVSVGDLLLNLVGAFSVLLFLFAFLGFQGKTLFVKKYSFLGYSLEVESHKGKELELRVKKQ